MCFNISELPNEVISYIIDRVEDRETLKSLVLTSKTLRDFAEPFLYRHNFFRTGAQAKALLRALQSQPTRGNAVHSLDARCRYRWEHGVECLEQILTMCSNLRDLTIESPFCNKNRWTTLTGSWWAHTLDNWMRPLFQATVLSGPVLSSTARPLQNLAKLTLHLNGIEGHEYWHAAGTYASIFVHPNLQVLQISSASLADDALELVPAGIRTPLKSLIFDQCNISHKSLQRVLAIPQALESLWIGEVDGGETPFPVSQAYNFLVDGDPSAFELALSQQRHSLRSLYYAPDTTSNMRQLRQADLYVDQWMDFSPFSQLETISIGAPCHHLERALTSKTSGPKYIRKLKISGTTYITAPQRHPHHGASTAPDAQAWSHYIINVIEALPSLSSVEVVLGRGRFDCFTAMPADQICVINAVNSALKARGGKLSVSIRNPRNRYIPPILHGEREPAVLPIFETDKGFLWEPLPPRGSGVMGRYEETDDYIDAEWDFESELEDVDSEFLEEEEDDWTTSEGEETDEEAEETSNP